MEWTSTFNCTKYEVLDIDRNNCPKILQLRNNSSTRKHCYISKPSFKQSYKTDATSTLEETTEVTIIILKKQKSMQL
jgi:hypothetical protein